MTIPSEIATQLRERITRGTLAPGERVESTRVLASQWGCSRGSVVAAYEQLVGEGYLESTPTGTRVNPDLQSLHPKSVHLPAQPAETPSRVLSLTPGVPDAQAVTSTLWRAAFRRAAAEPMSYPAPGSLALRQAVAQHLRQTRSVEVDPAEVLITSGARDGLSLLLGCIPGPVAAEDPGFPTLHAVPAALGREVLPVPVDDQGIIVEELERLNPAIVLVAPNHQYPTGKQMSARRRFELVSWARRSGAVIVEDDYDSELRKAHPALVALDPSGQVAMIGSFAKTLSPALGVGYLILPSSVLQRASQRLLPVSGIVQDALTHFIREDGLRRHTARMRREYGRRRAVFYELFPQGIPMDGGLHAVVDVTEEQRAVDSARKHGFGVQGLGQYWSSANRAGIVLGLGTHSGDRLRAELARLAHVLQEK
ncbi:PLP-dependent aminotransferase family protein [Corynebacterium tapiri]|uniref:PLP-dependent aminotransferase family protein n=1 Tax=Corynebacterium tapiri TaxID=1448266 RepID=A0A5C4U3I8_9CORY|nr:PLP-dependent aminotransferase family protein [Corynebacterium tapiri]TNL96665.1 PLP-dependent aminotransferase family protein [Corynebacterium tapiri]